MTHADIIWQWPQYFIAVAIAFSVFGAIALNGKPRTGTYNGAVTIIGLLIEAWVLHVGGFW